MPRSRQTKLVAVAVFVVMVLALSWLWQVKPAPPGLRFENGDSTISPLFVLVTRGQRETNYVRTPTGMKAGTVGYTHKFYCANDRVKPIPALRYWVESGLRWLGVQGKAVPSISMATFSTSTDTTVLWVGYSATNQVLFEPAVLVSDQGLRLPLTPGFNNTFNARSEHLSCWELPSALTHPGKFSLILVKPQQTLLTFFYE